MAPRSVFVLIAHPDDEAFGPSGTIALLSKTHEVHVICVTDGASDKRFHIIGGKELSDMRLEELARSAEVLGVRHVHFLHYPDGSLCNNIYHEIADKISGLVRTYKPSLFVTSELRGVSGHLDHVAVAMIASYVYSRNESVDAIWYNAVTREASDSMKDYFVFFPPGFDRKEVDMVVDVSGVFDTKLASARCHTSQQGDVDRVTTRWMTMPKEELFFVTKRRGTIFLPS